MFRTCDLCLNGSECCRVHLWWICEDCVARLGSLIHDKVKKRKVSNGTPK